ncbi:MAG TPA: outer membrane lipoprotein carrier protein LolA [Epulopiscium sp.]|nr:outer membrane lipoprotein carrier protein LolA [Candidatus Epulonipiscium sp.]
MSKKIIGLTLFILTLTLSGCRLMNKNSSHPSSVQEKLMNMQGYACVAKIAYIEGESLNTYEAKQVYQMNGYYRFEIMKPKHIEGLTTIYNGEKVIQYNPQVENPKAVELPTNNFRNQIFLGTFVQNYLQSEEVAMAVNKTEGEVTTMLEAVIPGGSKHMSTQRLWIDQKTYKPVRMAIYDQGKKETVTIEFTEFTYNPKIDESVFIID